MEIRQLKSILEDKSLDEEILVPVSRTETKQFNGVRVEIPVWRLSGTVDEVCQYMQEWRDSITEHSYSCRFSILQVSFYGGGVELGVSWYLVKYKTKPEGLVSLTDLIKRAIKEELIATKIMFEKLEAQLEK
jgi:hypothetical protein